VGLEPLGGRREGLGGHVDVAAQLDFWELLPQCRLGLFLDGDLDGRLHGLDVGQASLLRIHFVAELRQFTVERIVTSDQLGEHLRGVGRGGGFCGWCSRTWSD
jgi:hypothetical protein